MWQVVGHEAAIALLSRSLEREMLSHAYMFVGPSQVGKTTLALNLAQAANCLDEPAARPCGSVRPVRAHRPGHSPGRPGHRPGAQRERQPHPAGHRHRPGEGGAAGGRPQALRGPQPRLHLPGGGLPDLGGVQRPAQAAGGAAGVGAADTPGRQPGVHPRYNRLKLPADRLPHTCPSRPIARYLEESLEVPRERAIELARLSGGKIGWAIEAARDPAWSRSTRQSWRVCRSCWTTGWRSGSPTPRRSQRSTEGTGRGRWAG